MGIKSIITHDGAFHADEVMAIALIHELLGETPVRRTRKLSESDMRDPEVWVVDVGLRHDPSTLCFDHHHDPSLEASCKLVADHLLREGILKQPVYRELKETLDAISDIDRHGYKGHTGFQFNSLIRMLDGLEGGFNEALGICRMIYRYAVRSAGLEEASRRIWESGEAFGERVRVCSGFPAHWKRYVDRGILIYPDGRHWKMVTSDSEALPLVSTGSETFMHVHRFFALFPSREKALDSAMRAVECMGKE